MLKLFKPFALMFSVALSFSVPSMLNNTIEKVSATDTISISSDEEMATFIDNVNAGTKYNNTNVVLTNDVSISLTHAPTKVDPYSIFEGIFDGDGHTLTINYQSTDSACALFRNNNGTIKNMTIDGTITGGQYTSTLAIYNNGSISNVINNATISTNNTYSNVAGFVHQSQGNSLIENCVNNGNISGINTVAGIVNKMAGASRIVNCYNYGNITGTNGEYVAGVVSIAGESEKATIVSVSNCVNEGIVNGTKNSSTNRSSIGGICGWSYSNAKFTYCSNYGKVTASGYGVGGIAGTTNGGTFEKCYNGGNIDCTRNADQYMGGIVGYTNTNAASISRCLVGGTFTATKTTITKSGYLYGASAGATLTDNAIIANCTKLSSPTSVGDALIKPVQDMNKVNEVIKLVRTFNCSNTDEIKTNLTTALSELSAEDQLALSEVTFFDVTDGPYKTYYDAVSYILDYTPVNNFPNLFRFFNKENSVFIPVIIVSFISVSLITFIVIKKRKAD